MGNNSLSYALFQEKTYKREENVWKKVEASTIAKRFKESIYLKDIFYRFKCPYCGQPLHFVYSEIKEPHFRHQPGVECVYKIDGQSSGGVTNLSETDCSVILKIQNGILNFRIADIISFTTSNIPSIIEKETIYGKTKYTVSYHGNSIAKTIYQKTNNERDFKGRQSYLCINNAGAIFDAFTGRKISYHNSYPIIGKEYFFLIRKEIAPESLLKSQILLYGDWIVSRNLIDETQEVLDILNKMGYRYPTWFYEFESLWPPAIHKIKKTGEITFTHKSDKVYIQRTIINSIGKYEYTLFDKNLNLPYKEPLHEFYYNENILKKKTIYPQIDIKNENNESIPTNYDKKLKIIEFSSLYDGRYCLFSANQQIVKDKIFDSGERFVIEEDDLYSIDVIKIYYGLDCVWVYTKQKKHKNEILTRIKTTLKENAPPFIKIGPEKGLLLNYFSDYPDIKNLIKKRISEKQISLKTMTAIVGYIRGKKYDFN